MGVERAPSKQHAESPPGAIQHVMVGKLTSEVKRREQTGRTDRASRSKVPIGNLVQIRDPLRHPHSDRLLRRHPSDLSRLAPLRGDPSLFRFLSTNVPLRDISVVV
jgi:hypothetical protein